MYIGISFFFPCQMAPGDILHQRIVIWEIPGRKKVFFFFKENAGIWGYRVLATKANYLPISQTQSKLLPHCLPCVHWMGLTYYLRIRILEDSIFATPTRWSVCWLVLPVDRVPPLSRALTIWFERHQHPTIIVSCYVMFIECINCINSR